MKEAGFNVRKWKSSSKRLMEWIDEKDGVPIKEMVKLSREKVRMHRLRVDSKVVPNPFPARRKFLV